MNRCAVIATHHKTGTVWMRRLFQRIGKSLNVPCKLLGRMDAPARDELSAPVIVLEDHSEFRNCRWLLDMPDCRILHLIRDPRDVIISASHYHTSANEPWLRWRRKEFGGLSYRQAIRRLATDRDRYLFEMENSAKSTIEGMLLWDYDKPNSLEYKYEDLVGDSAGALMEAAFLHLGFDQEETNQCLKYFEKSSLAVSGEKVKTNHVRSGAACQWKTVYDPSLAESFVSRFGDALIDLGYEGDNSWVQWLKSHKFTEARQEAC